MTQRTLQACAVLEFRQVILTEDTSHVCDIPIDLTVHARDLVTFVVSTQEQATTLADACSGLYRKMRGSVLFLGQEWNALEHDAANGLRGEVGRTVSRAGWLDGLSVLQNVLLPQIHHTMRPLPEVRNEALALAHLFHLPGIPADRPENLLPQDLQRAACIRAFLGSPRLILLEEPAGGLEAAILGALVNAAIRATDRGSAVIWFIKRGAIADPSIIPANRRFFLWGGEVVEDTP